MNIQWLLIAVGFLFITSCSTSPTGRTQFTMFPKSEMDRMGAQSFAELKKKEPIETDPEINRRIRCIASHLTNVLNRDRNGWEVVVFRSKTLNAFALPGKKIGFYTGLINLAENDDQIAAVMGHEIGHVIANHSNERVSQNMATHVGLATIATHTNENDPKSQAILLGAMGVAQFGVLLPFSRKHESESDLIGQELMAKAGYDPRQAAAFWQRMKSKTGGGPPEFLSTHPSPKSRIRSLTKSAQKFVPIYEQNKGRHGSCS